MCPGAQNPPWLRNTALKQARCFSRTSLWAVSMGIIFVQVEKIWWDDIYLIWNPHLPVDGCSTFKSIGHFPIAGCAGEPACLLPQGLQQWPSLYRSPLHTWLELLKGSAISINVASPGIGLWSRDNEGGMKQPSDAEASLTGAQTWLCGWRLPSLCFSLPIPHPGACQHPLELWP